MQCLEVCLPSICSAQSLRGARLGLRLHLAKDVSRRKRDSPISVASFVLSTNGQTLGGSPGGHQVPAAARSLLSDGGVVAALLQSRDRTRDLSGCVSPAISTGDIASAPGWRRGRYCASA